MLDTKNKIINAASNIFEDSLKEITILSKELRIQICRRSDGFGMVSFKSFLDVSDARKHGMISNNTYLESLPAACFLSPNSPVLV